MVLAPSYRFRIRELFFLILGMSTVGCLGVLVFRLIPETAQTNGVDLETLSAPASWLVQPSVQLVLIGLSTLSLAAGGATRLSLGKDRATWFMALGCMLAFGSLAATVYGVYEPLNLGGHAEDEQEATSKHEPS